MKQPLSSKKCPSVAKIENILGWPKFQNNIFLHYWS